MARPSTPMEFRRFADGRSGIMPAVVDTLVELKGDHLHDPEPARWLEGDLTSLLVEALAQERLTDSGWFATAVPTVRLYVEFLRDQDLLTGDSGSPDQLLAELDTLEEALLGQDAPLPHGRPGVLTHGPAPLDDTACWGTEFIGPGSVFRPPVGAPAGYDPAIMPPIRLLPQADLAAAARRTPLMASLAGLARWVTGQRRLTGDGLLRPQEALQACRVLGLPTSPGWRIDLRQPVPGRGGDAVRLRVVASDGERTRRTAEPQSAGCSSSAERSGCGLPSEAVPPVECARELTELHRLWELGLATGWIVVVQDCVFPGCSKNQMEHGDDETVLQLWNAVFSEAIEWGLDTERHDRLERSVGPDVLGIVNHTVVDTLMAGYVGVPTSLREFRRTLSAQLRDLFGSSTDLVQAVAMRRLGRHLDQLQELGAAQVREGLLVLTPLGRWGMRELLMSAGFLTPCVGDLSGADALTLLTEVSRLASSDCEPAVAEWIAARDPWEAIDSLLEAARAGTAMIRLASLSVIEEHLPDRVPEILVPLVDDPLLGLHARSWLAQRSGNGLDEFTDEQVQWMAVETIAGMLDGVGPVIGTEDLPEDAWIAAEQTAQLDTISRCTHPQTLEVLDAIGSGHPRAQVRRAATKAAFRIRQCHSFRGEKGCPSPPR